MSSRANKRNANKPDLGGSHPQELKADHRHFLVRSLDRNDVELAALTKLNHSLKAARARILESCGELVLLDLGSGRLTLVNDELHEEKRTTNISTAAKDAAAGNADKQPPPPEEEESYSLTPAQKEVCVDFLLRMKLRRKLQNRLVRRLNRVAQAMDGADVSPPAPPRYGDLRLNVDPKAVKAQAERWERQAEAKRRIQQAREMLEKESKSEKEPTVVTSLPAVKEGEEETTTTAPSEDKPTEEAPPVEATESSTENAAPKEASVEETAVAAADETPSDPKPQQHEASLPTLEIQEDPSPPPTVSGDPDPVESTVEKPMMDTNDSPPSLQDEYAVLREYDDAYEKVWDKESKQFTYVLAKQPFVPDYLSIKAGAAIGAQTRLLSEQEREQEHKRWQTSLLGRIPHQPTFEELGLKNRVFYLEQRRNRCLEETVEDDEEEENDAKRQKTDADDADKKAEDDKDEVADMDVEKEEPETKKDEKKKDEDNDGSDMFGDDEEKSDKDNDKKSKQDDKDGDDSSDMFGEDDDDDKKTEEKTGDASTAPEGEIKKIKLEPRKKKEEETNDENAATEAPVEEPKRIRPMSLAAVPSFYEQDMIRIRAVHGDLLSSSMLEHVQRQMAEATNEYNAAFEFSNKLYEHKDRLQQNLVFFTTRSKTELAKIHSEYQLQVAVAKQRWLKQKIEHDQNRTKQFLPSNWGRQPFGTNMTQNYQRRGGVAGMVGNLMADIVDGAIIMLEGQIPNNKFEPFVPPPEPRANKQTGETVLQQHQRMELELKRQLQDCMAKLQASETERQRAWSKMMKIKAEIEPPSMMGRRGGRYDLSNYHLIPLPPLRGSNLQQLPREFVTRAAVASYTPRAPTSTAPSLDVNGAANDSKYSAARVRERISSDGTVAPVSEPKVTREGLYMRPAGRTRKGMQWDAVRGIWVPEGSQ